MYFDFTNRLFIRCLVCLLEQLDVDEEELDVDS